MVRALLRPWTIEVNFMPSRVNATVILLPPDKLVILDGLRTSIMVVRHISNRMIRFHIPRFAIGPRTLVEILSV